MTLVGKGVAAEIVVAEDGVPVDSGVAPAPEPAKKRGLFGLGGKK